MFYFIFGKQNDLILKEERDDDARAQNLLDQIHDEDYDLLEESKEHQDVSPRM